MIQQCTRCLYTSLHPLNITFNDQGLCSGCEVHEEKDVIDWVQKENHLKTLLKGYRNKSGNNYDCIIPVSGARDSYFIVHMVKNVFGMNPLLVTYNKQYNTDRGIRNLANLRIQFDCDIMTLTVAPEIVKKITRATIKKVGSIYWHCIAGQTVYPVQTAVKFKIPLIIWGAHQGIDQVGMFSHHDFVEMTRKYRKEHDLMGIEAEDLINDSDNITINDVKSYLYPEDIEIEKVGVRGIYLNNYMRWDTKLQHEQMINLYKYETALQTRTIDHYNDVDCFNYSDVHDYLKYLKHGYGKITDHICREIRFKRIDKKRALHIIQIFEDKKPQYLSQFLEWLGITENAFNFLSDLHRNKVLWMRNDNWEWDKIKNITIKDNEGDDFTIREEENLSFVITPNKRINYTDDKYILIGKGYNE